MNRFLNYNTTTNVTIIKIIGKKCLYIEALFIYVHVTI